MILKENQKRFLEDNNLELVEIKHFVIRPVNMCELYSHLIDEEVTEADIKNNNSFTTKVMRVINKLEFIFNNETRG